MPTLPRVMSRYLKKTQAQTSVVEVAQKMRDDRVGALLVEWNGEIVGIVTEWDIIEKVVAHGKDFTTTTAKDVMTSPTNSIQATNSLQNALEIMKGLLRDSDLANHIGHRRSQLRLLHDRNNLLH